MTRKLYVGNLPFSSTEDDLRVLFGAHGGVASIHVVTDRETGRARGLAFVEMETEDSALDAIRSLAGSQLGGRNLLVKEAREKSNGDRRPIRSRGQQRRRARVDASPVRFTGSSGVTDDGCPMAGDRVPDSPFRNLPMRQGASTSRAASQPDPFDHPSCVPDAGRRL